MLASCAPQPANTPAPSPSTAVPQATPTPTPLPSASVAPAVKIQQLITSSELNLKVGEEIMLIGDAMLSDGTKVSLDSIQSRLNITNQTPELLKLDLASRLVTALQSGTAMIQLAAKDNPSLQITVRVNIAAKADELDPNVALVDVQIE